MARVSIPESAVLTIGATAPTDSTGVPAPMHPSLSNFLTTVSEKREKILTLPSLPTRDSVQARVYKLYAPEGNDKAPLTPDQQTYLCLIQTLRTRCPELTPRRNGF